MIASMRPSILRPRPGLRRAPAIVAIVALDSLPVKRLIESAKGSTKLVDATNGRRTRAVIVTGSDHLILSSLEPATLAQRLVTDRGTPSD